MVKGGDFHSRCSFLLSLHPLTWEVARCHAVGSSMLGACTQSCLTLCDPRNCSPPGSSVHAIFPGKNTGVDRCLLLQGISPTQGLNPGLLGCMQILYRVSYKGSPRDSYKVSSMSSVLYSRSWLFIYFVYRNGYLLIPNS